MYMYNQIEDWRKSTRSFIKIEQSLACFTAALDLDFTAHDKPTTLCTTTTMAEIHDQFDTILILDFGSQVGV